MHNRTTANLSSDMESQSNHEFHMPKDLIQSLSWSNISLTIEDRSTKQPKDLVADVCGSVEAGRASATKGCVLVDGTCVSAPDYKKLASFVDQEDTLVGCLTVRETLDFAARLSLPRSILKNEEGSRVQTLIDSFGLKKQADTLICTSIRKGISGGQKRRVSIASQLITTPNILFLDEPTSGLDSVASLQVVSLLKTYAQEHKLIVVASIHQPSAATFQLFDKLLLLSQGQTCYFGSVSKASSYFSSLGLPVPNLMSLSEHILDLTNTDFDLEHLDEQVSAQRLLAIQSAWRTHTEESHCEASDFDISASSAGSQRSGLAHDLGIPITLLRRLFIKSYRDVVTFWIRVAMYMGLAVMMGTVWLRLSPVQKNIQSFVNALFFGSAFLSFMAVAYVPAFLEDRAIFVKERANGLYGPLAFAVSKFLIGLPFLFLISILFAGVTYGLVGFRSDATAFFIHVMWLFLDLVAAESLVVLVASLFPNFIVALTLVAFVNGLWMSVGGFLVPTAS
ncbi:putative ABC transporter, partial [Aureobasidium sp. EXF-8846]